MRNNRNSILGWVIAVLVAAFLLVVVYDRLFLARKSSVSRDGITLTRENPERVRLSWGTESGVIISAAGAMHLFYRYLELKGKEGPPFPTLTEENGLCAPNLGDMIEHATPAVFCSYINPRLTNADVMMFRIRKLCSEENPDMKSITKLFAGSYTYLGWVVMNMDDVASLKTALQDHAKLDLDKDIVTANKALYRLRPDVEKKLAKNENDDAELEKIRAAIPIFFEVMNKALGHPCDVMHVLYLDGHTEDIPFGERFPAVQGFVDAFPPPDLADFIRVD